MTEERDQLSAALRDIARDDRRRVPPHIDPRLLVEFRALHGARRPAGPSSAVGLGLAAILVAALAVPLWFVARGVAPRSGPRDARAGSGVEVTTEFMPLVYSAVPFTDAQLVRLEVPRAALGSFGLLSPDHIPSQVDGTVLADVLVGEDGLARAVRFVRAPSARVESAP